MWRVPTYLKQNVKIARAGYWRFEDGILIKKPLLRAINEHKCLPHALDLGENKMFDKIDWKRCHIFIMFLYTVYRTVKVIYRVGF